MTKLANIIPEPYRSMLAQAAQVGPRFSAENRAAVDAAEKTVKESLPHLFWQEIVKQGYKTAHEPAYEELVEKWCVEREARAKRSLFGVKRGA